MVATVQRRIAIVGAGPAGLTLAVLLFKHDIPFALFELRPPFTDEDFAAPSGLLDLHEGTGLAAIRACGLEDDFLKLDGDCSEMQIVANKQGNVIYKDDEREGRPEIARHKLVKLLLKDLPEAAIRYNHKLVKAESSQSTSEVILDFGANGRHTFDLVVGADGAWSKIRAMLTTEKPRYANSQSITINITDLTGKRPDLSSLIGTGSFSCLADHHGIMTHRAKSNARIYVFLSTEDEHFAKNSGLDNVTNAQAKEKLIGPGGIFESWGDHPKDLIQLGCDSEADADAHAMLDIKPLYELPVGHTWPHHPAATLVGDASHLMCPWAGEGVNLAMKDALDLAMLIIERSKDDDRERFDKSLRQFEQEMKERSAEEAQGTLDNGIMLFGSDDGAEAFKQFFESIPPHEEIPNPE